LHLLLIALEKEETEKKRRKDRKWYFGMLYICLTAAEVSDVSRSSLLLSIERGHFLWGNFYQGKMGVRMADTGSMEAAFF